MIRRVTVIPVALFVFLFVLLPNARLSADALVANRSMFAETILEMDVREDRIIAEWEIGTEDLSAFAAILPDEIYTALNLGEEPWAERLGRFFTEEWPVWADGRILGGFLESVEGRTRETRDPLSGEVIASVDEGPPVLAFRIVYPLDGVPATLEISGPPRAVDSRPANVGFLVSHLGVPVSEFYFLSQGHRLTLDWEDPWYSAWENTRLKKAYNSPINLFLYVENREVRTEVVIRPTDLAIWVDLELEPGEAITPDRREDVLEKAAEFLAEQVNLSIDGEPVPTVLDRIQFIERSRRGSFFPDPAADLYPHGIYIGAIFVTPTAGLPETASLPWNLFSPKRPVVMAASVDEAGPLGTQIIPEFPELTWNNYLTNPSAGGLRELPKPDRPLIDLILILLPGLAGLILVILGVLRVLRGGWSLPAGIVLVLASAAIIVAGLLGRTPDPSPERMAEEDRMALAGALLTNVYRSFDFRDEGEIYDILAVSARGEILQEIYLDMRKALEIRELGGARVKVTDVTVDAAIPREGRETGWVETEWTVTGTVGHWGHVHTRSNRYKGDIRLDTEDGAWKISGLRVLEEERIL